MHEKSSNFINGNYLEFDYGKDKWGTIISNLAFSSHFINHYLLNDGVDIEYAKTYARILTSLKKGGSWFYAPSLHFVESFISKDVF